MIERSLITKLRLIDGSLAKSNSARYLRGRFRTNNHSLSRENLFPIRVFVLPGRMGVSPNKNAISVLSYVTADEPRNCIDANRSAFACTCMCTRRGHAFLEFESERSARARYRPHVPLVATGKLKRSREVARLVSAVL